MSQNRTIEDFLKELEDQNISVAKWCREHSMSTSTIWALASGHTLGRSGEARRALELMGLPLPTARRDHPHKVVRKALATQGGAA
ncbi:MAG: hypothetical protein PHU77_00560 [Simplicispira sp.]|nr:hypothetical protein [Simplicispira sp.]